MAIVPMIFADTPSGGIEIHTSYSPRVGESCSSAQDAALEVFTKTKQKWASAGVEVVHVHASIEDALKAVRGDA